MKKPVSELRAELARGRMAHWLTVLGNRLLAGIAFAVPLVVTYWVLSFGYRLINGLSEPWLRTLGLNFPGLGFLITLMAFIGLGFMATHVLGRRVLDRFDRLVLSIPVVSAIYAGTKQLIQSLRGIGANTRSKRVVMVEYFTPGSRLFGFATGQVIEAGTGRELTTIFVPTAPNPTTGIIIAVPTELVIDCDMSVEEVSKMLFSGGLITPMRPIHIGPQAPGPAGAPQTNV
jgi:uncharacterized membrane protein